MNIEPKLKIKLNKLYELAKRGVGGEKENAGVMLQRMLDKHNLTLSDIDNPTKRERMYKFTNNELQTIYVQVVFSVVDTDEIYTSSDKHVIVEADDFQHIQILESIDFHKHQYMKERRTVIKTLTNAYIQKHNLFRKSDSNSPKEPPKHLSKQERKDLERMFGMVNNLENVSLQRKIEM